MLQRFFVTVRDLIFTGRSLVGNGFGVEVESTCIPDERMGFPSAKVNLICPCLFLGLPRGMRSPHFGFIYLR